ncbi:MAG TPA: DUF2231 domain-containing protein [Kofleriaceae bacterium]|nr:DUF2231 domain-containing protein [Kofleriaceae bacterium]
MSGKSRVLRQPVRPALVAFPVAFYALTFASLVGYALTAEPFWFRMSLVANLAGVAAAAVAALPGIFELARFEALSAARRTGAIQASLNLAALGLFAINLMMSWSRIGAPEPPMLAAALLLTGGGVLLTSAGSLFGWNLVQRQQAAAPPARRRALGTSPPTRSDGNGDGEAGAEESGAWETGAEESGAWMEPSSSDEEAPRGPRLRA